MERTALVKSFLRDDTIVAANTEFLAVVEDYFELSLRTQNLCASLQKSVQRARDYQVIITRALALQQLQISPSEEDRERIMDELSIFMAAAAGGFICTDEFVTVYDTHVEMQSKFGLVKKRVEGKLNYFKGLMKGCSVAAGHAKRLSKLYVEPCMADMYERDRRLKSAGCSSEQVLVEHMNMGTFLTCKNMETMRVLVDRLEGEVGRIVTSIEFGERHGNCCALLLAMEQIRTRQVGFLKQLEEFEMRVRLCNKTVCSARAVVLQNLTTSRNPLMVGMNSSSATAFVGTLLYSLYIIVYVRSRRQG